MKKTIKENKDAGLYCIIDGRLYYAAPEQYAHKVQEVFSRPVSRDMLELFFRRSSNKNSENSIEECRMRALNRYLMGREREFRIPGAIAYHHSRLLGVFPPIYRNGEQVTYDLLKGESENK